MTPARLRTSCWASVVLPAPIGPAIIMGSPPIQSTSSPSPQSSGCSGGASSANAAPSRAGTAPEERDDLLGLLHDEVVELVVARGRPGVGQGVWEPRSSRHVQAHAGGPGVAIADHA